MTDIKINLPTTEDESRTGNGEGVFVLVDDDVKRAYDNDEEGTEYRGILDNDSWSYPGLIHGEEIPIEMRGSSRPVVPYKWLLDRYGEAVE